MILWNMTAFNIENIFYCCLKRCEQCIYLKARLHGSPSLINVVESTKVNRVNGSFQRKWSTGLTGEQVGDGQFSFKVVDSFWVTHHKLPV